MERLRRVQQIWNWLPAFRAVAETEHLPTAAERLHVSASALSRTVRLLEEDLGVPLFHRVGRRIVLNDAGRALLERTRSAMRLVHDAVDDASDARYRGSVRVSAAGLATEPYVVPGLVRVRQSHPEVVISVTAVSPPSIVPMLERGDLDVAVQSVVLHDPRVTVYHLGEETNSVYCGPSHPLHGREDVSLAEMLEHPFAAPPADALGRTPEGWPVEHPREVRWAITQMAVGLQVCSLGEALAVLPDVVARERPSLWRLPVDIIPSTPVVAITRKNLGTRGKAELIVEAVQAVVAEKRLV